MSATAVLVLWADDDRQMSGFEFVYSSGVADGRAIVPLCPIVQKSAMFE